MKHELFLSISLVFFSVIPLMADTDEISSKQFKFSDLFSYEQPEEKKSDEKKWFFNLAGGFTRNEGNTESENSTYGSSVKFDNDLTELKLTYNGSYGKLNNVVIENRGTVTGNFDQFLFWRIKFFSYSMSDYDKIIFLKHRNGTGAGAKIYLIRNEYLLVDLSAAPIYQYEKFEELPAEKEWRWSIRGRVELFPFSSDFFIKYSVFYIPQMENNKNYRTIQNLTLYKKLVGSIGISAGYRREYNTYDKQAFIENPLLKKTDSTTFIQASLDL